MVYRFWIGGLVLSLLLLSQPASADRMTSNENITLSIQAQVSRPGLPDPVADRVLGQPAFNTNLPGTSAAGLHRPSGLAIAPPGSAAANRLFVVEYFNHRVLSWPSAGSFSTGQPADLVIGQENFISGSGGLGVDRFNGPEAAVVDPQGSLWVADTENNRVLRFDPPFSNGIDASLVLGQPNFVSKNINQGGSIAANTLFYPRGLALDNAGNLYVADDSNHRVLRFSPPFSSNMNASLVIGQQDFTSGAPNRGGPAGQNTLYHPKAVAVDSAGNLYIAEYSNNRVTRYHPPFSTGMDASGLFGQTSYSATLANDGGIGPGSLAAPVDLAVSAAGQNLYVTDQGNVRVLGYSDPMEDSEADQVYGQPDFFTNAPNPGGVPSAVSINNEPLGVAVDPAGSLYLADFQNNRILAYDTEVVGNGTPGSCNEASLDAALAGGGSISFNCGTAQINLNAAKLISANTTIDGGEAITLSGQSTSLLFYIYPGASLTLRNVTLTEGYSDGDGGAIYNDGKLTLESAVVRNSQAVLSGGAIVSYGPLTIKDSLLEGNRAQNGGALYPRWSGALTTIANSVLRDNHAVGTPGGWGGAILVWDGAAVVIKGSQIYGNTANDGAGIYNFDNSAVYIYGNSTLRENTAASDGGSFFNRGSALLVDVLLSGNSAAGYGGGIYNEGSLTLNNSTLSGNTAGSSGGGLYSYSGAVALNNSTLNLNTASYGGGFFNNAAAALTNVTLSGNSAGGYGGGLYNDGTLALTNTTISDNAAPGGGGIYNDAGATALFKNSIIANSRSGGNCAGMPLTNNNADTYSLSSDNTCILAGVGSRIATDPLLTALGDYGGPTKVHMLRPGSPAIDGVVGSGAPATDQRGVSRPQGAGFDIGSVEVAESDLVKKVYLPMTIR